MKFYTYAHYTADTKVLFYIGKGTSRNNTVERARTDHGRNQYWKNKVNKHGGFTYEILSFWETEKEAFDHECLLISIFKPQLVNLTFGGEGVSGYKQSEELKKKRADAVRGQKRTKETLKKMSNAQKINTVAIQKLRDSNDKLKKKVLCVETNEVFDSLVEAGKRNKIPFQNISKSCLGKRPKAGGFTWKYIE